MAPGNLVRKIVQKEIPRTETKKEVRRSKVAVVRRAKNFTTIFHLPMVKKKKRKMVRKKMRKRKNPQAEMQKKRRIGMIKKDAAPERKNLTLA
jgi:hypothetical protein